MGMLSKASKRHYKRKTQREANRHAEQTQRLNNERARIEADSNPANFKEREETRRIVSNNNREIQKARAARSKSRNRAVAATGVAANTDVALDANVVSGGVGVTSPTPRTVNPQPTTPNPGTKPYWATGPEEI